MKGAAVLQRAPVGVLGGTFDPVHFGHLRPALELQQALGLAELRLVPGRVPPHREPPRATAEQRAELLHTAVAHVPGLSVDERELARPGPSYTIETLRSLRAELGDARPLCFILGADAFLGLTGWHRWRSLTDYAHLVVMQRPGHRLDALTPTLAGWLRERRIPRAGLRERPAGGVCVEAVSPLAISATGVRRCLAQGRSARYLIPEAVWARIAGSGLYGYPQP